MASNIYFGGSAKKKSAPAPAANADATPPASEFDADADGRFEGYIASLDKALAGGIFNGTVFEDRQEGVRKKLSLISKCISPSVTISTMHGCPPHEIEAICTYMLTEKKVDTFVKLNPTLLGYDKVRSILDG